MRPRVSLTALFMLLAGISLSSAQQSPPPAPTPASQPSPAASQATANDSSQAVKPKKVWTNENLGEASGMVSVVGDPKNAPKGRPDNKVASAQFIQETRRQLEKLRKQIEENDKQIGTLKNFLEGEGSGQAERQLHKGYGSQPVPQQIAALETKKQSAQAKIDVLLDEARKRGVQPGELR